MNNTTKATLALLATLISASVNAVTLEETILEACYLTNSTRIDPTLDLPPPDFCSDIPTGDPVALEQIRAAMTPSQFSGAANFSLTSSQSHTQLVQNRLQLLRNNAAPNRQAAHTLQPMRGGAASADDLLGQGIAVFGNITTNDGYKKTSSQESGYDWDSESLFAGGDYRLQHNLIIGAGLGISGNGSSFANGRGEMNTRGLSVSTYGSFYHDIGYMDWLISYNDFSYDIKRKVTYLSTDTQVKGETDGGQWSASLSAGHDKYIDDKTLTTYLRATYTQTDIDAYTEQGPSGYTYQVSKQKSTSSTSTLGLRLAQAQSYCWGVFSPSAYLEYQHEFQHDARTINSAFTYDPNLTFNTSTDVPDRNYLNAGLSAAATLPGGHSAYASINHVLKQNKIHNTVVTIGYRGEF